MNDLKISIIMSAYKPTKNGLYKTIKSVLNQSFKDFEFIIIKDDEEETTLKLLNQIETTDNRIKILDNIKNIGLIKSLNNGLKEAKGKYIARIDVDDWWEKDKLKIQYDLISSDNDLVIVGTQVNLVDTKFNKLIKINFPLSDNEIKEYLKNGKNPFTHSSVLFKKFDGIFYNENALHTEDFELWCRYSFLGKMQNVEKRLTNYVVDLNSITGTKRYLMFANATKVYENYMKYMKVNDKNFIKNGLIDTPFDNMNLIDKLFSKYYSLAMNNLFKSKKFNYYIFLIISLLINPKVLYFLVKRKLVK